MIPISSQKKTAASKKLIFVSSCSCIQLSMPVAGSTPIISSKLSFSSMMIDVN